MTELTLLYQLLDAPGVSGREDLVRDLIRAAVQQAAFFDRIEEDPLGNLICYRTSSGKEARRNILLAAHMDQSGFLVSRITDEGALRLHPVGTFDVRAMAGQPVSVVTGTGTTLPGTLHLSALPVHTAPPEQMRRHPELADFHVDLGLSLQEVTARVQPGDMVVFRSPAQQVGDEIAGTGLDDRIGCWAMIQALHRIHNTRDDLVLAFTVQEELGSRGASPVARRTAPDIALICESVVSACVPGVPPDQQVTVPGQGIALQIADSSLISDPGLVQTAERAARDHGVPVQRSLMQGGGQDGAIIQRSGFGVRTLALGCPVKFMHSAREHACLRDILSYPTLIAAIINTL